MALSEGIERLVGLRRIDITDNLGLNALPAGVWSLAGLVELYLRSGGLTALSGERSRAAGRAAKASS
jgi:hypothetical protein